MSIEQFKRAKKQELLNKYAKFFAADKYESKTQFQGIRYSDNGVAYVTDSHILLRMKDVSPLDKPLTLHAVTGAELEGAYPSDHALDNLLNWTSENRVFLENTEQIETVTRFAKIAQMIEKELSPKSKTISIYLRGEKAYLENTDHGVVYTAPLGSTAKSQFETWTFSADHIFNTLSLFKSAQSNELVIKFKNRPSEPIIFSDEENGIDVLIMPIRSC